MLLQCHFGRCELSRELTTDLHEILEKSTRLLQAMVDVLSSSGWLSPALAAMELCQMCVQGMWDRDPVLFQLPHVTRDLSKSAASAGIDGIFVRHHPWTSGPVSYTHLTLPTKRIV